MARTSVGLDIGSRTVHVAEVAGGRGAPTITNFGGVALPEGAVREGEIVDTAAVADAIKELYGAAKLKNKKVHIGVANQRVVVRQIDLPWMEEDELRSSLPFQVQEFIPIAVEDAQLDYYVLQEVDGGEEGGRTLRILLVAAHKDMLASHMEAAQSAGLKPVSVDLNPFAQLRVVGRDNALGGGGAEVLVDIGGGVTDIVVHENAVPNFVRILVLGGEDITDALASGMGVSHEEAEQLKQSEHSGDATADRIIDEHARQFVEEVRGSLDYYRTQVATDASVSRIVVTGGAALLPGLVERMSQATNVPVQLGNPFDRFAAKGTSFGEDELARVGPTLVTAVGLALGGVA